MTHIYYMGWIEWMDNMETDMKMNYEMNMDLVQPQETKEPTKSAGEQVKCM